MELSRIVKSLFQFISPSGTEETIAKTLKEYVVNYVDSIYQDAIGNLICTKYSKDPQTNKTIMFVAHMDEIGLMVTYIEESGYIRFTRIGGVDLMLLKGRNVKIVHGDAEILGVIVIIALLLLLIIPAIVNRITDSGDEATEAGNKIIFDASDNYIDENVCDMRFF